MQNPEYPEAKQTTNPSKNQNPKLLYKDFKDKKINTKTKPIIAKRKAKTTKINKQQRPAKFGITRNNKQFIVCKRNYL